jgi:invasion protein IalB
MRAATKALIAGIAVLSLFGLGSGSVAQTLQPKATQPGPGRATAPAQAGAEEAQPPRPTWMVNCTSVTGGFDCRASQTIRSANSRERLLTLAVQITPDSKKPIMLIQGPLGMYLPAGVTLQVGRDAAKVVPLQTCDQSGCFTKYDVTDAEIAAMRSGADLTVTILDVKKAPVELKVPGLGFDQAYAKLE